MIYNTCGWLTDCHWTYLCGFCCCFCWGFCCCYSGGWTFSIEKASVASLQYKWQWCPNDRLQTPQRHLWSIVLTAGCRQSTFMSVNYKDRWRRQSIAEQTEARLSGRVLGNAFGTGRRSGLDVSWNWGSFGGVAITSFMGWWKGLWWGYSGQNFLWKSALCYQCLSSSAWLWL